MISLLRYSTVGLAPERGLWHRSAVSWSVVALIVKLSAIVEGELHNGRRRPECEYAEQNRTDIAMIDYVAITVSLFGLTLLI